MPNKESGFAQTGYAVQTLPPELLASLEPLGAALQQVPARHWTRVIKNGGEIFDLPLDSAESVVEHDKAVARLDSGELCYSFQRIQGAGGNLDLQAVRQLQQFLLSPAVCAFIHAHTGRTAQDLSLFYVNKFGHGDFLTTHRDAGDNLALVINLTRNWNPNNGGITFLLDQDQQVLEALNPCFGQALLLDCQHNTVPHFVSTVTSPAGRYRTAIVARYARQ